MIFHCPACRELVDVTRVVVEGGARAGLPCVSCGQIAWLPVAGAAGEGAAPAAPASAAPRDDVGALAAALEAIPADNDLEQQLTRDMVALLERWHDYGPHRSLIRRANVDGALAPLGVRYRRVLEVRPNDESARRAQQEILSLAMASLSTTSSSPPDAIEQKRKAQLVALVVAGVVAAGSLALLALQFSRM